jgi:hypothetical protein
MVLSRKKVNLNQLAIVGEKLFQRLHYYLHSDLPQSLTIYPTQSSLLAPEKE